MAKSVRRRERVRTYVRKRATSRGPNARRYTYTPELLARGRHLYEHTETSIPDIALEFGIHKSTMERLARRLGWVRFVPPPRDLSETARLLQEAEKLAAAPPPATPEAEAARAGDVERLERLMRVQMDIVEALHGHMHDDPQSPLDAERVSRALSNITATMFKLRRLRDGLPEKAAPYEDDMPADIDEFREQLAHKIELFLVGWRARGAVEGSGDHDPAVAALQP